MSNQQTQMSRRDWFRLSKPAAKPAETPQLGGHQQTNIQPSEQPVNHGGIDLASLPPLHEATLCTEDVRSLFSDIEQHANSVQFVVARSAAGSVADQAAKLSLARDQLLSGKVNKLQIRYQWDHASWIDTLQHADGGFRLVRIKHD